MTRLPTFPDSTHATAHTPFVGRSRATSIAETATSAFERAPLA